MAAIMLQTNHCFLGKNFSKSLFIFANTYEKYIVCKDHCIDHQDDKTCLVTACKYHIILLGELEELLQNLVTFSSPMNTWTVYIPCLFTASMEKLLQGVEMCLLMCREQSLLTKETGWTKCRVLQKRNS